MIAGTPVVQVRSLCVEIIGQTPQRLAVDSVSFDIHANETVCLVGESGSGKSMIAHALIGLLPSHGVRQIGGQVFLEGQLITGLAPEQMRRLRGTSVGMIFQEPMTALNPLLTVAQQIDEVFRAHTSFPQAERARKAVQLLADDLDAQGPNLNDRSACDHASSCTVCKWGFNASFSASPIRLMASTVSTMANPEKKLIHHACRITVLDEPMM